MKPGKFLPLACLRIMLLALGVILAASALSASAKENSGHNPQHPSALEKQVRQWAEELARQEPFAKWKEADLHISALGPGTHSWLAVIKSGGETVGYMVVHAAEDGSFRLGEYGTGPHILFSESTMRLSLLENGLIESENVQVSAQRHYFHPLAAVWEVQIGEETYWIDAKTGEWLPFDSDSWRALYPELFSQAETYPLMTGTVSQNFFLGETFDAYESLPWLAGEKPYTIHNAKKAQRRIVDGVHLVYVTQPYGEFALYALPVTGFHAWKGGRLDLALDMAGIRFIPLQVLQRYGTFYE